MKFIALGVIATASSISNAEENYYGYIWENSATIFFDSTIPGNNSKISISNNNLFASTVEMRINGEKFYCFAFKKNNEELYREIKDLSRNIPNLGTIRVDRNENSQCTAVYSGSTANQV